MNIPTFKYEQQPDGSWQKTVVQTDANPADYQWHNLPGLEGVAVGIRHEENGKVIVPPMEKGNN